MKKIILVTFFIISTLFTFSQSQGPNNPSTAIDQNAACLACSGADWVNPNNCDTSDGIFTNAILNSFPTCFQSNCYNSRDLFATNFGFSIPITATITGILVEIQNHASIPGAAIDSVVQLMTSSGTLVGQNKRTTTTWATTSNYVSYGGNTDTWGYLLTPAIINNAGFGVALKITNSSPNQVQGSVDNIRITVYYSTSVSINEIENNSSDFTVYPNPATTFISIKNNNEIIESTTISDALGKIYIVKENKNKEAKLNIENLDKGIYFIKIKTNKGIYSSHFIKQ